MPRPSPTLVKAFERLRERYANQRALEADPLSVVYTYEGEADREVAAWVAAHLAYGRVAPMLKAIRQALAPLGATPAAWLRTRTPTQAIHDLEGTLANWVWRFHTGSDIAHWLGLWSELDRRSGLKGLEEHLLPTPELTAEQRLSAFVQQARLLLPMTPGLRFFLPDPASGSACKRWRMFLRWMVRTEWPDLGLWRRYPPRELVIPLDTHVARMAAFLEMTERKNQNGKMAQDVTSYLARLAPDDPLKYDFALAHLGILGHCGSLESQRLCDNCPLHKVCKGAIGQRCSLP